VQLVLAEICINPRGARSRPAKKLCTEELALVVTVGDHATGTEGEMLAAFEPCATVSSEA
jgi:hypothetical protein